MKPSIPKGTRDFLPEEMIRRNYIFNTIRRVFEKYAYFPIETPSMENLSTLMGKYGEEGDRLLFKILNSGDFMTGVNFQEGSPNQLAPKICEKGLRYDLTVPFARFVVQHRDKLVFPFKRYQMQPVWRADRPQKGRYREFYQCDVDVIGSTSLLQEVELLQITYEIFEAFKIPVVIKMNNRKILSGIAEIIGLPEKITDICVAIDKMDKIGRESVFAELREREIPEEAITKIAPFFDFSGKNEEKIAFLSHFFESCEIGKQGVEELNTVFNYCREIGICEPELDITLARGLNYYTGAIFEVKATNVAMGSISGGGRYDDLTGIFGLKDMSGVGISYGAERIYDILNECNLFPNEIGTPVKALFLNFGEAEELYALKALTELRQNGIASEIYPDRTKIGKQMSYANAKQIPYVIMAGEEEMKESLFTLKNMVTGEQIKTTLQKVITLVMSLFLLFCFVNVNAQRFEVHAIKDFSLDENANKAWGVGGAVELDQLVKKMSFKINFDWGIYKDKENANHLKYQRMGGGISVCYNLNFKDTTDIKKRITFQFGMEINYTHLRYSYIYDYSTIDSVVFYPLTTFQTGNFIGIGPYIGAQFKLTPRFNLMLNCVPSYLIRVSSKSSELAKELEYKKGIWLFPIRLGLSYQLFKHR